MAKARLIDFRGGINEHISSHMIGDSQGQNAVDVDLGSVRLQGRIKLDNVEKAEGTFYYDTGDTETSRWVSTNSTDGDAYIAHASDFAVWNRDLYVALGATVSDAYHSDGLIVRFLDGAQSGANVAINPPASASCTITEPDWDYPLIVEIPESGPSGGDTGIVTTVSGNHDGTNWTRIYHTYFGSQTYSQSSNAEPAAYGERTIWTRDDGTEYVLATGSNDGVSGSIAGDLMTWSGGSISGSTANVSTVNADSFKYQADGSINNSRAYVSTNTSRQDTSGNTYYEYSSSVLGSAWAQSSNNLASPVYSMSSTSTLAYSSFSGTVTEQNRSQLYPAYTQNSSPPTFSDARTDTENTQFTLFSGGGTSATLYRADATNSTLGVTVDHFYTQDAGSGGTSNQVQTEYPPASENGWDWIRRFSSTYNRGTSSDTYWREDSGVLTIVRNGTTVYTATGIPASYSIRPSGGTYASTMWKRGALEQIDSTYGNFYRLTEWTSATNLGWIRIFFDGAYIYTPAPLYTYADATSTSLASTVTINGYTYTRGNHVQSYYDALQQQYNGLTTSENYKIVSRTGTVTVNNNYTYTIRNHTQSAAYSFSGTKSDTLYTITPRNYQLHQNTTPSVLSTPATPAFTYDKARNEIYQIVTNTSQSPVSDSSFSSNWMIQDQSFSGASDGYYLKTVQADASLLPQVSNTETKATNTVTSTVFGTDAEHTPLRLNFTITQGASTTPVAYKLRRLDDRHDVELGYIMPETATIFSYTASTKTITLANLDSSATYQLRFHGYQDTLVQVGGASAVKSNVNGVEFSGSSIPSVVLSTSTGGDSAYVAADFWLKKQVLAGTSVAGDETYAVVKCFDVIHKTSDASPIISGECDFLDGFQFAMAGSGVGTGDNTATDAPNHLRFLKESNNFFFGVGTSQTAPAKYGGVNKKGTFLFVSAYNDPTNWPLTGYVQFDSEITGLASYPGELIVFTENGVYRVTGSRFDQMRKTRLATTEGLPNGNHKTIAIVNNYLCWLSASGICFYNGATVSNLTRGRFSSLAIFDANNTNIHAGQYEDSYYVVNNSSDGYVVDFSLEGFPVSKVDLKENITPLSTQDAVLHYVGSKNKLYTRNGVVEQDSTKDRNTFTFKTRAFDGGAFGSLKYIKNICINGTGSGQIQIYLDGNSVFTAPKSVAISATHGDQPTRVYLPANPNNIYGLPVADVWSVEIIDWDGQIDWIDAEYEVVSN